MHHDTTKPTNLFELTGDATVSYSTSSFAGPPQFSYHDSHFNVQVSGADIRTADHELGKLVTITLVKTVDVGFTTVTLLLPAFRMGNHTEQPFETIGIICRHLTTLLPPQHAALQTYKALKLHGTAKHVAF